MAYVLDYQSRIVETKVDWQKQTVNFLSGEGKNWSYEAAKAFCTSNYPGISVSVFNRTFNKVRK